MVEWLAAMVERADLAPQAKKVRVKQAATPIDTRANAQSVAQVGGRERFSSARHRSNCRARRRCPPAAVAAVIAADLPHPAAAHSIRPARAGRQLRPEAAARRLVGHADRHCRRGCRGPHGCRCSVGPGRGSPDSLAPARNSVPARRSNRGQSNCYTPCKHWLAARLARPWRSRHNRHSRRKCRHNRCCTSACRLDRPRSRPAGQRL